ncbi:MAG: hypothetical protein HOB34_03740 [Nitrospina sp.]|nr:hypothetical protein [Nitrospina sp.]
MKDIGKSKGGATPGEVASKVIDSLQKNINGAVKHLNLDQVKEVVGSVVSGAKDMLEKGTSGTKDLVENNPMGDAVKGIFGN